MSNATKHMFLKLMLLFIKKPCFLSLSLLLPFPFGFQYGNMRKPFLTL